MSSPADQLRLTHQQAVGVLKAAARMLRRELLRMGIPKRQVPTVAEFCEDLEDRLREVHAKDVEAAAEWN